MLPSPLIAVADNLVGGHHESFLKASASAALNAGFHAWILSPSPHDLIQEMGAPPGVKPSRWESKHIKKHSIRGLGFGRALQRWEDAAESVQRAAAEHGREPDLVFFNSMDPMLSHGISHRQLSDAFPWRFDGIYFQPRDRRPKRLQRFRKGLLDNEHLLHSPQCVGVTLLDESLAETIERRLGKPVDALPDFADLVGPDLNNPVVVALRERAEGRTVVGLYGSMERRKGLLTFADAAEIMRDEPFLFAAAGNFGPGHRATYSPEELNRIDRLLLDTPNNMCLHLERLDSEAAFNGMIGSSDIIYVAYKQWAFSSNLLSKAAGFHKPVISAKEHLLGERTVRYGLGKTVTPGDVEETVAAIRELARKQPDKSNFNRYTKDHSYDRYLQSLGHHFERLLAQ